MGFSRFYNAPAYQYVPQSVPRNLEVIDKALARKQDDYEKQDALLGQYRDALLKQDALEGYDTEVRDRLVKETQDFSASMVNQDLTSADNKRKVNEYIQGLINNEDIKKLNQGLASKAKYIKIKEDLMGKKDAYASENDREFIKRYESYLSQQGDNKKFGIDFIGGHEQIAYNAPSRPELEGMINNKLGSSYVRDDVSGEWINKTTRKALTDGELRNIMASNFQPFMNTAAGKQMRRRAEIRQEQDPNWTLEQQYWEEANPVIAEKTYSERKDEVRSNADHLNSMNKLKDDTSQIYTQDALTSSLLNGINTKADGVAKVTQLRSTGKPEDAVKADLMEGQLERFDNKFQQNLTPQQRYVINTKAEDLKDKPAILHLLARELYGPNELISLTDPNKLTDFQKSQIIEKAKYKPDLVGEILGNSLNVNYNDLKKQRDDLLAKGEHFQKTQILLEPNKAGLTAISEGTKALPNYVNSINYDFTAPPKSNFGTLEEAVKATDYRTFNIQDGPAGPEFVFQTKATKDLPSETWSFQPKDWSEATERIIRKMVGEDKAMGDALIQKFMFKSVQPLAKNNTKSQSLEMGLDEKSPNYNLANSDDDKILVKNLDNKSFVKSNDVINKTKKIFNDINNKYGRDVAHKSTVAYLNSIGLNEDSDYTINDKGDFKFKDVNFTDKDGNFKFNDNINAINYLHY